MTPRSHRLLPESGRIFTPYGTRVADGGSLLPATKDVMGHRSVETTERYTHTTDEAKRRTMEIAGRKVIRTRKTQKAAGE